MRVDFLSVAANRKGIFIYRRLPSRAVVCPVCGYADDGRVCGRCGTDLDALEGADGKPRLEIRPTQKPRPHAGSFSR